MGHKIIIFLWAVILPLMVNADDLTFQVVEKDFSLTPELVSSVQRSQKNPNSVYITLTDKGLKKLNHLLANSYDKKLNIMFNEKIVQLSTLIKTDKFSNRFYLNTKDPKTTNEVFNYLHKK